MSNADGKESFLHIDEHLLDEEWIKQPKLYYTYAHKLARAKQRQDEAKANLEVTRARQDKAIREDPAEFDVGKVTEASVAAAILLCQPYVKAQKALIEAQYSVNVLQAAVIALDHRKKALESLVHLHGQNYFSAPRASTEDGERLREKATRRRGQFKREE